MSEISNEEWVAITRNAGKIKRCHTHIVTQPESVAQHSWGVAMLIMKFNVDASKGLICAALTHDVHEIFTGDVPAHVKWINPDLNTCLENIEAEVEHSLGIEVDLNPEEQNWLKVCDYIDLLLFSIEELLIGNSHASIIAGRLIDSLDKMSIPNAISTYYNFLKIRVGSYVEVQKRLYVDDREHVSRKKETA